ncbi:MAG TPA: GTP 3',8-cyclase MoaA [Motilibacterales bacterium]|nr:GTP 3',8-cyclase MoaA [Motilibacterales bacterium]
MTATPATPEPTPAPGRLVDRFGRSHHDLRVSLTDRCNLRCTYCMPAEGLDWMPKPDLLTADEIERVVRVGTELGITEVRLTGGEPLIRPDVVDIVARLATLPLAPHLSVTTNGLRLAALAGPLAAAGLSRVNISCDTLSAETFARLTLRNRLEEVLAGIAAAREAGLAPIKINTVLMRGVNDHEAAALLRWALAEGLSLRFIEQMPLDPQHGWNRAMMVTREEILEALERAGFHLAPLPGRGSAPAEEFAIDGGPATVGIVGSVTNPFCDACDRVRLTADGHWRSCLFAQHEVDLRTVLRGGGDDQALAAAMIGEVALKQRGHGIDEPAFIQPDRPMSAIGG